MSKTLTEQYRGNIPLGKGYKLIDIYYKPKDEQFSFTSCQNCGIVISNIYTIQDVEGNKYDVGSECVNAILEHSLELIEAKRKLAQISRFVKVLRTKATSITLHPKEGGSGFWFRFYKGYIRKEWDVNAIGYGDYNKYKYIIDTLNIPITQCAE